MSNRSTSYVGCSRWETTLLSTVFEGSGIGGCRGMFDVEKGLVTFDCVDGNGFIGLGGGAEELIETGLDCTNWDPDALLSNETDEREGEREDEGEGEGRDRGGGGSPVSKKSIMLFFS